MLMGESLDMDTGFKLSHEVTVYKNGSLANPKVLSIPSHWTTDDFLNAATTRLALRETARFIFNQDGTEVDDVAILEDGDIVFVATSREFRQPRAPKSKTGEMDIVGGYQVGEYLGEGGFGTVRMGKHQVTGDVVALKFLPRTSMGSARAAQRVVTEIQCLTELNHQHVIKLRQVLNEPTSMVLVLEYAPAGDLRRWLNSQTRGVADERQARDFFKQLLSAVAYAHKHHICHRDLKLENLLLSSDGQIKVTDFGLSTFFKPGELTKISCGSLNYLAPETLRGTSNEGPPVDVWAMGVILYALLYGRLPFQADQSKPEEAQEREIRSRILRNDLRLPSEVTVSSEARDLIRSMLQETPEYRVSVPAIYGHPWVQMSTGTGAALLGVGPPGPMRKRRASRRATAAAAAAAASGSAAPSGEGSTSPHGSGAGSSTNSSPRRRSRASAASGDGEGTRTSGRQHGRDSLGSVEEDAAHGSGESGEGEAEGEEVLSGSISRAPARRNGRASRADRIVAAGRRASGRPRLSEDSGPGPHIGKTGRASSESRARAPRSPARVPRMRHASESHAARSSPTPDSPVLTGRTARSESVAMRAMRLSTHASDGPASSGSDSEYLPSSQPLVVPRSLTPGSGSSKRLSVHDRSSRGAVGIGASVGIGARARRYDSASAAGTEARSPGHKKASHTTSTAAASADDKEARRASSSSSEAGARRQLFDKEAHNPAHTM